MSGRKQHEIPKSYLRGFLVNIHRDTERVFLFRKGAEKPHLCSLDDACAQRDFNSKPSNDGSITLDDRITDYENRLDVLIKEMRSLKVGSEVNADTIAEVLSHLTVRNAHIRGVFTQGFQDIAKGIRTVFSDEDYIAFSVGLDKEAPNEKFRNAFGELFQVISTQAQIKIPQALIEKMTFCFAKESLGGVVPQSKETAEGLISEIISNARQMARDGHNMALAKTFVPEGRKKLLSDVVWHIVEVADNIILPDCIAIAELGSEQFCSLVMADFDEISEVLVPLTSRSLIIGTKSPLERKRIAPDHFNAIAAACSLDYFVSATETEKLMALMENIGKDTVAIVESIVHQSVEGFRPSDQKIKEENKNSVLLDGQNENGDSRSHFPLNVRVTLSGDFEEAATKQIGSAVKEILAQACWTIPLDRLDGITFADNYAQALQELDHGFPAKRPVTTYDTEKGKGYAQSLTILRDGVVKSHVIIHGSIARALIDDDTQSQQFAIYVIVYQLAQVGCTQIFDETLPGILLSPFMEKLQGALQACVYPGWHAYFSARACAFFDETHAPILQEVLSIALDEALKEIQEARLSYRSHGNLDIFLQAVYPRISFVLEHAAGLLGHADGLGIEPLEETQNAIKMLEKAGLKNWFFDYRRHLRKLWDNRGAWASFDEFIDLNRHAERLLWHFGIYVWPIDNDHYYVEVPLQTDMGALIKDLGENSDELRDTANE